MQHLSVSLDNIHLSSSWSAPPTNSGGMDRVYYNRFQVVVVPHSHYYIAGRHTDMTVNNTPGTQQQQSTGWVFR